MNLNIFLILKKKRKTGREWLKYWCFYEADGWMKEVSEGGEIKNAKYVMKNWQIPYLKYSALWSCIKCK